jgi:hypothetical protein
MKITKSDYEELVKALKTLRRVLGIRVGISSYDEIIINGFAICKVKKLPDDLDIE